MDTGEAYYRGVAKAYRSTMDTTLRRMREIHPGGVGRPVAKRNRDVINELRALTLELERAYNTARAAADDIASANSALKRIPYQEPRDG